MEYVSEDDSTIKKTVDWVQCDQCGVWMHTSCTNCPDTLTDIMIVNIFCVISVHKIMIKINSNYYCKHVIIVASLIAH